MGKLISFDALISIHAYFSSGALEKYRLPQHLLPNHNILSREEAGEW